IARYTSSGIGKTRTRLMNPMMLAPMYSLNPNRHPPANDAQNRCVSRLHTRYAAHAATAGAAASQALSDASGPNTAVIGHATSAGPGTKADQDRLTPVGANTELAYNGLTPWLTAHGVHSSAHWEKRESCRPAPMCSRPNTDRIGTTQIAKAIVW